MSKLGNFIKDTAESIAVASGVIEYVDENGRPINKKRRRKQRQPRYYGPRISARTPRLR